MKFLSLSFSIALFSCAAPQMMVPENNYKLNPPTPVYRHVWSVIATDLYTNNSTEHNQATRLDETVNLTKLDPPFSVRVPSPWSCMFSKHPNSVFIHCGDEKYSTSTAVVCPSESILTDTHNHQTATNSFIIRNIIDPDDLNKGASMITIICETQKY